MTSIKHILIERDGLTAEEADLLIKEAKEQADQYMADGDMDSAGNICQEYFGLEPDYLFELLTY